MSQDRAEAFGGTIGRTHLESTPWWPSPPRPPGGAPNVLVVVLDDTGFGHLGCYGSTIDTPTMDRLAAGGLRYTGFHTTALCSPSRACLLTGRNHHAVGMRSVSNFDTGFPHMRGAISRDAATVAELLEPYGYATYAVGKWHLAPMIECSAAGPHDNWPLARGFDRFYGFLQGETDQFHPELTIDNHHVDPPAGPDDGYHLTEDLVDQAIGMVRDLRSVRADRPWLMYLSFGATHAPHQAPPEYLAKYRGRFDAGWDVVREEWFERQQALGVVPEGTGLAPRNPGVPAWDDLTPAQQRFAARLQEAFAAFLDHTDHHLGRLVDFLADIGELDDTLVVLVSDNGASQEGGPYGVMDEFSFFNLVGEDIEAIVRDQLDEIGGPRSHSNYPWGWAQAGNTPLRWYKQNTHGGGVRDPLIVHWPARIHDGGGIRTQFHHIVDIVPTILEVTGIDAPETVGGHPQQPIHGVSLAYTWDEPDAPSRKGVQYFEQLGHRGIWLDGWKAVTRHMAGTPYEDDAWELYHLDEDFSELHDLAAERPDKLRELVDAWWVEAGRNGVLPLDDRTIELFAGPPRPGTPHVSGRYRYLPPLSHLPADVAPRLGGRSWRLDVRLERAAGDDGVLVAHGSHGVGYVLYVADGAARFEYNALGIRTKVAAPAMLPEGEAVVSVRVVREESAATLELIVDGAVVASASTPRVVRMLGSGGLDIGRNGRSPISDDYDAPFAFTGLIREVVYEMWGRDGPTQAAVELRAEMAGE
ncbi:MAG: arylsulfatase [Acidimicrobiales bacterium]|nr:arylsulfatase [Acidimicrobiales bacterium]